MVPRLPVPSRAALAPVGLPSTVSRAHPRSGRAARRGRARAFGQGAPAQSGVVSKHQVAAGAVVFGGPRLVLIAGPCVIESEESCLRHAERLAAISRSSGVPIVFKSSFDKANRTSQTSFRGPGLQEGLRVLEQ